MMDYVNNSIHSIRNLRSWGHFITQFPRSVIEHKRRNNTQFLNLLKQLWLTENLLYHLSKVPTLKTNRLFLRELDDATGRAIALVKEVYLCSELPREHYSGEHYLEGFLELRWWTWVVICVVDDEFIRKFGLDYLVIPKGVLDPAVSSRLPSFVQKLHLWWSGSDGYARHLPSYGIEAFLRKAEGQSTLSVWLKTTSGGLLNGSDVDTEYIIEGKALVPVLGAHKPPRVSERKVDLTQVILGVSHSALVIKCEDSGTEYALKRVNGLDLKQPILAHLYHPHVVRLLDFWRENGFLFLAMELMEGDLAELIARRLKELKMPFTMDVAVDFMLQIAKTMLYLHDLGLTHPHLKSSDVLFIVAKDKPNLSKNESHYLLKLGDFRFYAKNDFKSVAQQNVYQFGLICVEVLSNEPLRWRFEERILGMSQEPKDCFDALRDGSQSTIPELLTECIGKCLDGTTQFSEVVVMLLLAQLQVLTKAAKEPSDGEHLPLAKQQDVSSRPGSSSRFPIIPKADRLSSSDERRAMAGTSGCSRELGGLKLSDTSCATSGSDEYVNAPPSEAYPVSASWSSLSGRSEKRRLEEIPIELLNVKPVGIEKKVQKIEKHLKHVSIVGLVGMGGAGKSTLSLQTFNSMKKDFKKSCFVDVEGEHAQDVSSVLKKLRRELCKCHTEEGNMTEEDLSEIKYCLKSESESVLVVLDDVKKPLLDFKVFEELGSKCKLVVTTRDQTHLQVFVNDNKAILEKVIGIEEGGFDKELFYSYAFHGIKSDHEKTTCKEIGDKIVERCGGLPLSLKVIGQTVAQYNGEPLHQRVGFWKDIYEKLCDADEADDNNKLWPRLEISYNSLGDSEKKLFLDCACMQRNEDKIDMVSAYGNIYGPSTVRTLENRFLISIDRSQHENPMVKHPRVVMHEQLRDMGRRIAKRINREYKSFSNEDISELGNPDFKTLRFLSLKRIVDDLSTCLPDCFSEVEYLWFDECNLSLVENCLLRCSQKEKLNWLFIDSRLLSYFSPTRDDQSIRSLINVILGLFHQMLVLQLFGLMITGIPQSIGNLKYLKMLEIHCKLLKDLPEEIGHLQELRRLDLSGCYDLLNIPSGVGNLSKLEYLNLYNCRSLQSLCDFEVGMDSLQELILFGTGWSRKELVELKGLANLRRLQTLNLSESSFRKCNLPGCLEILSQLRRLFITSDCHEDLLQEAAEAFRSPEFQSAAFIELHLAIIPETCLPSCPNLIDLRLENTLKLQEWPDLFLNMPKLQVLHLDSGDCCNEWRELPRSFGALVHLKELVLEGFQYLEEFPESTKNLTQLEEFRIRDFPNLLRLPVCLKSFEHLREVWIEECPSIKWEESGQEALRDMPSLLVLYYDSFDEWSADHEIVISD